MNEIWIGTEASFHLWSEKYEALRAKYGAPSLAILQAKMQSNNDDDETKYNGYRWPNPVGYEVIDKVAILTVADGTESKTSWITRVLGIPTYEDIRYRFMEAYEDANVTSVLLLLDTPGGMAKGAFALSEFIASYNNNIKPVVSFTDGAVASAGVLYGTAASALLADPYAEVGSVGAVVVFMEMTDMLKQIGIKVKVARSAPYKAVPNRYEKLDEKGEEVLEEMVMRSHNQFVAALSKNLGMSADDINKNIATGKMFAAPEAVSLGLAQGLTTFEKLVASIRITPLRPRGRVNQ
jgi:signal peptide peptidase SppA